MEAKHEGKRNQNTKSPSLSSEARVFVFDANSGGSILRKERREFSEVNISEVYYHSSKIDSFIKKFNEQTGTSQDLQLLK